MSIMTKPPLEARTAIAFITVGTLLSVWCGIWYWYLSNNPSESSSPNYFCTGLFLSGIVLIVIGLTLGKIGRAARQAELPPAEAMQQVVNVDQSAASRAPMIAPVNPAQVMPPTQVAMSPTGAVQPVANLPVAVPLPR